MEYEIIEFECVSNKGTVAIQDVYEFISDAEFILSNYGYAWSKDFIVSVGWGINSARVYFEDSTCTNACNIKSKLVKVIA